MSDIKEALIGRLQDQVNRLQADAMGYAKEETSKLEEELSDLRKQHDEQSKALDAAHALCGEHEAEIDRLKKALDRMGRANIAISDANEKMTSELETKKTEHDNAKASLVAAEGYCNDKDKEIARLLELFDAIEKTIEKAKA